MSSNWSFYLIFILYVLGIHTPYLMTNNCDNCSKTCILLLVYVSTSLVIDELWNIIKGLRVFKIRFFFFFGSCKT